MKRFYVILCAVLLLMVSGGASAEADKSPEAARVGAKAIDDATVTRRTNLYANTKYNLKDLRYVTLAQLIRGELALQLLQGAGIKIGNAELEAQATRDEANLQSAEGQKLLKIIAGSDRQTYLDTFVLPAYAEKKLYNEVFLKAKDTRKKSQQRAEALLRDILAKPAAFAGIAGKSGAKVERLSASLKNGITLIEGKERRLISVPFSLRSKILETALSALKNNEVSSKLVEWPDSYLIVRMAGKEKDNFLADVIFFPVGGFNEWFFARAAKIPVKITDPQLKKEFLKNVEWAKKLNLK